MLVLIGVALALFLVGAAAAARRVAKVPTIRIAASKQAPELTLAKGMTWHLFNSHIWSTGQEFPRPPRPTIFCREYLS